MLTEDRIDHFLKQIEAATKALQHYKPETHLYNLEANLTLQQLKKTLSQKPINPDLLKELKSIFSARWSNIQCTNIEYLHDLTNPASKICIELSYELGRLSRAPYLTMLMPSLAKVASTDYITSSYNDEIELYDIVLSDCGKRIISISDVLSSADVDGILKHNSLFGGKVKALSDSEIRKVLSRHSAVKEFYDAIEARTSFKLQGDTVGAALNRLISGLRAGGVTAGRKLSTKDRGLDDNSGYDANTAIVEFSEYLETLSQETRKILMDAQKTDRFDFGLNPQKKKVSTLWGRLARPKDAKYMDTSYCVELAANHLEEILNENPGLFDLVSYEGDAIESLAKLEEAVVKSREAMMLQLKTIEKHDYFDDGGNRNLSLKLYKLLPGFILRAEDIAFIADNYVAIISKGPDFAISKDSHDLIKSIAKKYSPVIIMKAMELMTVEGKKQFIDLSDFKEPKAEIGFFAAAPDEEAKSSRKRRADEAGMAPNRMASYG